MKHREMLAVYIVQNWTQYYKDNASIPADTTTVYRENRTHRYDETFQHNIVTS